MEVALETRDLVDGLLSLIVSKFVEGTYTPPITKWNSEQP